MSAASDVYKRQVIVKGDINPSGRVDITDVVTLCKKMFNGSILDTYQLIAADMNNDSRYDITDIVMICRLFFR